ncbi:MAG: Uma2 family endonuclease [Pseudonocardia sp.]|nr:Uma2 family endonuclease [Pseudonocardia sp.]
MEDSIARGPDDEGGDAMVQPALAHDTSQQHTIHDLFDMPEDGHRYEVEDGVLIVSPAPTDFHQIASDELYTILRQAAPDHLRVVSAAALRLRADHTGFVPDLKIVRRGPRKSFSEAEDTQAVVEIVSPSSRHRDRVRKPELYARAGIACYWRVELNPFRGQGRLEVPVVIVHELVDGAYSTTDRFGAGERRTVALPYPVTLDPATLLG